jgi:hypothetical protein
MYIWCIYKKVYIAFSNYRPDASHWQVLKIAKGFQKRNSQKDNTMDNRKKTSNGWCYTTPKTNKRQSESQCMNKNVDIKFSAHTTLLESD